MSMDCLRQGLAPLSVQPALSPTKCSEFAKTATSTAVDVLQQKLIVALNAYRDATSEIQLLVLPSVLGESTQIIP